MSVTIALQSAEIDRLLQKLSSRLNNMQPIMAAIGEDVRLKIHEGFDKGIDPYRIPWAPLKSRDGQILRDTGALFNSISYKADRESVTVGTNLEYGVFHQYGTKRMPKRQFIPDGRSLPSHYRQSITIMLRDALADLAGTT